MTKPEEQQLLISAATAYVSSKEVLISLLVQQGYQSRVIEDPETGEQFDVYAVHPDYAQAFDVGHYDPDTHTWDDTIDTPLLCSVLPLGPNL